MDAQKFDKFVEKLALTIENDPNDYKQLVVLQQECLDLLNQFQDQQNSTIESLRHLSYFRLKLKQLLTKHHNVEGVNNYAFQPIEFIIDFLDLEIDIIDKRIRYPDFKELRFEHKNNSPENSIYKWTDRKSDLIEVLQGITLLGSINDGNIKKSDFIIYMGKQLNVNLQNHYGLFNDILNRYEDPNKKYARIYYLRKMIEALQYKLEALDNKQKKG